MSSLALVGSSKAVVSPSTGTPNLLQLNSLSTDSASQVDLTNNALILHGGPLMSAAIQLSSVAQALKNGFNGGYWNGTNGIMSSAAANDSRHLTTIGYMQSNGGMFDGVATTTERCAG